MIDCISPRNAIGRFCASVLFLILPSIHLIGFANAQSQALWQQTPSSPNDPTLVRQSGVSIQQPVPQNQSVGPPSIQSNGQRVFVPISNSNAVPGNTVSGNTVPTSNDAMRSEAHAASWKSESPTTTLPSTSKSRSRAPLELKPSSKDNALSLDKPRSSWAAALSMFFSLAVVLSFFLLVAWLVTKSQPNSFLKLPGDVVQVLGRTPMAPRQQMYVVRFGSKLLLISHQPGQTQTLGEITDAEEVQRLAGKCEANHPGSISNSFRDVLKQVTLGKSESEPKRALRS